MERNVYVGLGSNVGDRPAMLEAGRRGLATLGRLAECSSVYETEPWGVDDEQPMCLNQVCRLETGLAPEELLRRFHEIEARAGRVRDGRVGPRELDVDLLLYGALVMNGPEVVVPHPRMCERAFVMAPLAEIAPGLVVPGTGRTVAEVLAGLDVAGVRVWEGDAEGEPSPSP